MINMKMDNLSSSFCLMILFLIVTFTDIIEGTIEKRIEVQQGEMVQLDCPSNDDDHRFQFWMLNSKDYIGPGSLLNETRYSYEVLSGTLYIRSVSTKEHGIYSCFCRRLTGVTYNIKSIELIVTRDWEDVYENDTSTNVFRITILFLVVIVLFATLFGVYHLQRRRPASLFREMDEESPDEEKPRTSFQRMVNITNTIDTQGMDGFDNPTLDTELPTEFQSSSVIISSRP